MDLDAERCRKKPLFQIFLHEVRAQVDVALDERSLTDVDEGMNLARFDDQDISRSCLMVLAVDGPASPSLPHEHDLVIRVTMQPWSPPRRGVNEVGRNRDVAVLRPYELMCHPHERKLILPDDVHG